MHNDDPRTAYFKYPVLDCPTTTCFYKCVYTLSFAIHVLGWNSGLGVSGIKPSGEGVLGTLAGVSKRQAI
jgi:hypothetical protein